MSSQCTLGFSSSWSFSIFLVESKSLLYMCVHRERKSLDIIFFQCNSVSAHNFLSLAILELQEYSFFLARNFFSRSVFSRYWPHFERIACFESSLPASSCYVREGVLERETFSVYGPGKAVSSTHISLRVRSNQWHARTIARPPHTSARCQHLWPSWSGLWLSIGECKGGRERTWGVGGIYSTTFSSLVPRPRGLSSNAAWVRGYTFQQTLLLMWLHMIQQLGKWTAAAMHACRVTC